MVTFSDYGNVVGQLHTIYGLVGLGVDQEVVRLEVPVFTHRRQGGQEKPVLARRE